VERRVRMSKVKEIFTRRWILWVLMAIIGFFALAMPRFWSVQSFKTIVVYTTEPLLLALGQTFVIISGGIDLSVGSLLGFSSVTGALISKTLWSATSDPNISIALGIATGLLVGTVLGIVNGVIIAKLRVAPFVVTLGMMGIARGATYLLTAGHSIFGLPSQLAKLGNFELAGVLPVQVIILLITVLLCHFMLSETRLGRYIYAIGGNRTAASRAGIPITNCIISIYAISGFLAGFAGVLTMSRFATGSPLAGVNAELNSIAAAVIGGVSLSGGIGDILGSVIGAFITGVLLVGLVMLNVQPYWQMVVVGGILIIAVFVDQLRYGRRTHE